MAYEEGLDWSLCHETPITWEYCRPIVEQAGRRGVRRLELGGMTVGELGNADAFIYFRDHPEVRAARDQAKVAENIEHLRRIVRRAHELGMETDLWHREVFLPQKLLETHPALINADGDIDFQGPYLDVLRQKIEELFDNVPELDGFVLTLTEAMFPIIHVANKQANPPQRNIENVIRAFKAVCDARGKRFMLRPFAALKEDDQYLQNAILRLKDEPNFMTQIKIVPADWHPFLPINPMIDDLAQTRRMIELDLIGEYYGHGRVPCCFPDEIKRYMRHIRDKGISRVVGRVDRAAARGIDLANEVNILAMHRCREDPDADVDRIYLDWATDKYDARTAARIIDPLKKTFEIVKHALYLDRHNISHWAYLDFNMLKWSRFFGFFKPGEPLRRTEDEWAILSDRISPSFEQIIREKDHAVQLADECRQQIESAQAELHRDAYEYLAAGFAHWGAIARAYREICRLAIAYVQVVRGEADRPHFDKAQHSARAAAAQITKRFGQEFYGGIAGHLHDAAGQMAVELDIELDLARRYREDANVLDWVLCGGISFEWAVRKQTHGSWVYRDGEVIYRRAGNRVIADGYFEYELNVPQGACTLGLLWGDTGEQREAYLDLDGQRQVIRAGGHHDFAWVEIPLRFDQAGKVPIRITKKSRFEPWVSQMRIKRA